MSLIESMMEDLTIMNKVSVEDGQGGNIVEWSEGATIKGAITLDTSMRTRIAESEGFTNSYTVTTNKNVSLDFHDVIKRNRDGKIFRITSDGSDKTTPAIASLDIRQASAELWRLT